MKTRIKISKENDRVIIPTKRPDDAGYDLYVNPEYLDSMPDKLILVEPLQTVMIPVGIRTIIDKGFYGQIQERGSTGTKGMKYGAGVIDASFRGEWNVVITNTTNKPIVIGGEDDYKIATETALEKLKEEYPDDEGLTINYVMSLYSFYPSTKGIAQFVVLPVPQVTFEVVDKEVIKSNKTSRGEGKLGSSGK